MSVTNIKVFNEKADKIIKSLEEIEWLVFDNPRFVRRRFNNYLTIRLSDQQVTDNVIRSILNISDLHGTPTIFASKNHKIVVEFLLHGY